MSIKFTCRCGKRLRARDEMAARRSMCPRCGAPVGIPSLRPTHAGTHAAPLTPQERLRRNRHASPVGELFPPAPAAALSGIPRSDSAMPHPHGEIARRIQRMRMRQMEAHWYQCLAYPFLGWQVLGVLTLALSLLSGGFVLLIPELHRLAALPQERLLPYFLLLLGPLLLLAYTCGSVECALMSALAGQGSGVYYSARQVLLALKSCARWLLCFLAGPVWLIMLAGYYWLYGGDLTQLDWVILGELGVVALAYWLLAVVASCEGDRFRDANPLAVLRLVSRLSYRAAVPALLAPALLLAHVLGGLAALMEVHRHTVIGWLALVCCWGSALFWMTFLFRLLGVWCYRSPR